MRGINQAHLVVAPAGPRGFGRSPIVEDTEEPAEESCRDGGNRVPDLGRKAWPDLQLEASKKFSHFRGTRSDPECSLSGAWGSQSWTHYLSDTMVTAG